MGGCTEWPPALGRSLPLGAPELKVEVVLLVVVDCRQKVPEAHEELVPAQRPELPRCFPNLGA